MVAESESSNTSSNSPDGWRMCDLLLVACTFRKEIRT
jgi:hypothetical protein